MTVNLVIGPAGAGAAAAAGAVVGAGGALVGLAGGAGARAVVAGAAVGAGGVAGVQATRPTRMPAIRIARGGIRALRFPMSLSPCLLTEADPPPNAVHVADRRLAY